MEICPDRNPRQYSKGNHVRYIPGHVARNDYGHPDCEDGIVIRQSEDGQTVFVLYDNVSHIMMTGDEPFTAKATNIDDLRFMGIKRTSK